MRRISSAYRDRSLQRTSRPRVRICCKSGQCVRLRSTKSTGRPKTKAKSPIISSRACEVSGVSRGLPHQDHCWGGYAQRPASRRGLPRLFRDSGTGLVRARCRSVAVTQSRSHAARQRPDKKKTSIALASARFARTAYHPSPHIRYGAMATVYVCKSY